MPQAIAAFTLAANLITATPAITPGSLDLKPDASCTEKACVKDLIEFYAIMYGVKPEMALAVAQCESEFKTTAVGDHGKAYGVFQFHKPTFTEFARQFGDDSLDYKNAEHAIELAMWAISHGKGAHWTCYRNLPKTLAMK